MTKKYFIIATLSIMAVVTFYFANYLVTTTQTLNTQADSGSAQIYLEPNTANLPPTTPLNLWITASKPVAFAKIELSFNKDHLGLTEEITLVNPALTQVITKSTMAQANQTGQIAIVVAVDQTTVGNAPSGTFKVATLKLNAHSTSPNLSSSLTIPSSSVQIVDTEATIFNHTTSPAILVLNPSTPASPSPSSLPGDFNQDGTVDLYDFNLLVTKFNDPYTIYDFNSLVVNFGNSL